VNENIASILVVDDEPHNFDVLEGLLFRENYHLAYVGSGFAALEYLEDHQPDLILLDVMMPELDGIELCHRLKNNVTLQHIPIVMITALDAREDLARCLDAGANDFLSKPMNSIELRARIRSMLRIKQQYDALKAVLHLREDLSNMIVHDLRNPLASILLACEVLKLTNLQGKQPQKVEQIQVAGQQLQSMIDSLLIMAKLEAGKMQLDRAETNLCQIGQRAVNDFKMLAALKSIQVVCLLPAESDRIIWLDATVFRRILDNLLSNAIKFSPRGSQVTLQIDYPNPTQVIIQVADEGTGVSENLRQKIFEKFEIGTSMQGVSQTGLGLAFCKMAIAAHGGTISVAENQPQGAIFRLELNANSSRGESSPV
jgi:two-component system, sensor histidine kinase and response regulator